MKEKVIAVLTSHDALKKDEHNGIPSRADFAAYLTDVFTKAEQYDALAAQVAEQQAAQAALAARVAELETKISK